MRTPWLVVLGSLVLPLAVMGQEVLPPTVPEVGAGDAPTAETSAAVLEPSIVLDPNGPAKTEITLNWRSHLGVGAGFSGPLGAVGSLRLLHGLGADVRDDGTTVKAVCAVPIGQCAKGFLLQADAGSGGGKLSLGLGARARVDDEGFHGMAGVALRVALAHTWGNPLGTEPGLTYLGPELDLSVLRINLTLGVLWRVSGQGGASALFSWGLGFGL